MSMDPDPTRPNSEQPAAPPTYVEPTYGSTGPVTAPEQGGPPSVQPGGPTNGFAIASLVLGIIGLIWFPPVIPSILALIFGYKAKREIDRSNGHEQGRSLAVAGIVLGWVAIAMVLVGLAFFATAAIGLGVFQELGP